MQPLDALVVCRYNQARSIVIGALLRKLFKELSITTAGFQAQNGSLIPTITMDLCESWGISAYDRASKDLTVFPDPLPFAHILAADELVYQNLKSIDANKHIDLLTNYADSNLLAPIDPTGMDPGSFAVEVAKACLLAIRWAENVLKYSPKDIKSYLFLSESTLTEAVARDSGKFSLSNVLVDTEFAYPDPNYWRAAGYDVILFHPRDINSFDQSRILSSNKSVLVSKYEIDIPERILLSSQWRELLSQIAEHRAITLVSRLFGPVQRRHLGILGLSHSHTTSVL